ncbi:MAG: universal stress protein [Chthoniobacter sp.]|nr:universal stress protein [Chthoniobacter sp.]
MKTPQKALPRIPSATPSQHLDELGENKAATGTAPPVIQMRKILVPIDFSEMSMKALRYAVAFARQFQAGIVLLHVVGPATYPQQFSYIGFHETKRYDRAAKLLEELRKREIPLDLPTETIVTMGIAFDAIVETAKKMDVDLIITTTHGHTGLKHVMIGSTAERIASGAPCPVLVVRIQEHEFV